MLSAIEDKDINYHTYICESGKLEILVQDTLKSVCGAKGDSVIRVNSKSDVTELVELSYVMPFNAKQWVILVDYDKVKGSRRKIINLIKSKSSTSKIAIKFSKYIDFKNFNDELGSLVNSMYLNNLNLADVRYLFKNTTLDKNLFSFVFSSYRSEVDKLMELRDALNNGETFKDRKSITNLVGLSTGSLQHFVIKILLDKPLTERSFERIFKTRLHTLIELEQIYGSRKLGNFITAIVKDVLDIKTLHMMGEIYTKLDKIPQGYDSKRLLKYKYSYSKILEIDYSRVLEVYLLLENSPRWVNSLGLVHFLSTLYRNIRIKELSK